MNALAITEAELSELLVTRLEVLDDVTFAKARAMSSRLRLPLFQALVEHGRIPSGFLLEQIAEAWGVGFIDLNAGDVRVEALVAVPAQLARARVLVSFRRDGRQLHVAMANPRDKDAIAEVERSSRLKVVPYLAPERTIHRAQLLYDPELRVLLDRNTSPDGADSAPALDTASAVPLVDRILGYAAVTNASDIHVEPHETEAIVRCRVDGLLREILTVSRAQIPSLISRLKIVCSMRIDERRVPQDGRFEADLSGFKMDLRVSSVPTLFGEKVVLRVLPKENHVVDLDDLRFSASDLQTAARNIARPFGMILVTGPTGSGKSTTLYSFLGRIGIERQNVINISTIEDPIEFTMPRVNQIPINLPLGLDFATGLRALLRQDPDVIMVGEIRDADTADTAVRAAMVGRLLLSTLHTNDATGAVARLLDMGIEPFLLASTLSLVVGQRLVRQICVNCRESQAPEAATLATLQRRPDFERTVAVLQTEGTLARVDDPFSEVRWFRGRGCVQCQGKGYRGRLGLFEMFEIDDDIRPMIMDRRDGASIRAAAIDRGMKTMFQDGVAKVLLGETTLSEVFRVAG